MLTTEPEQPATDTPAAPASALPRKGSYRNIKTSTGTHISICASHLEGADDAVHIDLGQLHSGAFHLWISAKDARHLAHLLIAAAEHYDAETARLAGQVSP